MSANTAEVINTAIRILIGDKIGAAHQAKIADTLQRVIDGEITEEQAIDVLRPEEGDALDKVLGN